MFSGFNLKLVERDIIAPGFYEAGRELFDQQKSIIKQDLNDYVLKDGILSESKIEKDWFPSIEADVFLSHSHRDEKLVISLAGWLYQLFGIRSFIDSCVWGYSDDLLKLMDNKYCVSKYKDDGKIETYSYEKRNGSTSNVHMILSSCLVKMIDNTECLIFVNTPNSLNISDAINNQSTSSPWIYNELLMSKIIRHKKLSEYRAKPILEHRQDSFSLSIKYDVTLDHLCELNGQDLLYISKYHRNKNPKSTLDELYKMKGIIDAE